MLLIQDRNFGHFSEAVIQCKCSLADDCEYCLDFNLFLALNNLLLYSHISNLLFAVFSFTVQSIAEGNRTASKLSLPCKDLKILKHLHVVQGGYNLSTA